MASKNDVRVNLLGFSALSIAGSVVIALSMASTAFPLDVAAADEVDARRETLRIVAEAYGYRLEDQARR